MATKKQEIDPLKEIKQRCAELSATVVNSNNEISKLCDIVQTNQEYTNAEIEDLKKEIAELKNHQIEIVAEIHSMNTSRATTATNLETLRNRVNLLEKKAERTQTKIRSRLNPAVLVLSLNNQTGQSSKIQRNDPQKRQ